jgi:Ca2+-binding RTX toxin-like protein
VNNLIVSLATTAAQNTGNGNWTISGVENLSGGIGNDNLTGDDNNNVLAGDRGNDILTGGLGSDTLYGDGLINVDANGVTTLYGDAAAVAGTDTLSGGDGDDFLYGGGGNDVLKGDKDNDTLYGGTGNDTMTGGAGNDRYVIEANSGADTISGFTHVDKIVFDGSSGVTSFAQLTLTAIGGTNTLVTWGNGNSITITGLKPKDMLASDFQFTSGAAGFEHAPHDFAAVYMTPHDIFI